jgi:hypothetical protein
VLGRLELTARRRNRIRDPGLPSTPWMRSGASRAVAFEAQARRCRCTPGASRSPWSCESRSPNEGRIPARLNRRERPSPRAALGPSALMCLAGRPYVYTWVDDILFNARLEGGRARILVVIGAT